MALYTGGNLEEKGVKINFRGFSEQDRRSVALSLLEGLAAAHEAGLVLKDVKTANILLVD